MRRRTRSSSGSRSRLSVSLTCCCSCFSFPYSSCSCSCNSFLLLLLHLPLLLFLPLFLSVRRLPAAPDVVKLSILLLLTLIQCHRPSLYNSLTNSVKPIVTISLFCCPALLSSICRCLSICCVCVCAQRKVKKEGKWLSIITAHFMATL